MHRKAQMIRLLIADDHKLAREGFIAELIRAPEIEVVGEARNGLEAVELAQQLKPDVILMDIEMPRLNGLAATERLIVLGNPARVLMTSVLEDEQNVRAAEQSGARGYIFKGIHPKELVTAIHTVYQNQRYHSPAITASFYDGKP